MLNVKPTGSNRLITILEFRLTLQWRIFRFRSQTQFTMNPFLSNYAESPQRRTLFSCHVNLPLLMIQVTMANWIAEVMTKWGWNCLCLAVVQRESALLLQIWLLMSEILLHGRGGRGIDPLCTVSARSDSCSGFFLGSSQMAVMKMMLLFQGWQGPQCSVCRIPNTFWTQKLMKE